MRSMREAKVTPTAADRFEAIVGGDRFSQFSQLADTTRERFLGRTIWNINAAGLGGVDVPDGATEEALAGGISQLGELGEPVAADDGFEPIGSSGGDLGFAHAAHLVLTAAQLLRLSYASATRLLADRRAALWPRRRRGVG